jgi:hypothetical protein
MNAVVVRSTIHDFDEARRFLRDELVPRVSQAPGFVAGYWVRLDESHGASMIVFESEDAARGVADQISPPPTAVEIDSVQVGEVVEQA